MEGGLLAAALASRLVFGLAQQKGVSKGGFVIGGPVVEFEGDAVGALIEEADRVEETRVDHELHDFSVPHTTIYA